MYDEDDEQYGDYYDDDIDADYDDINELYDEVTQEGILLFTFIYNEQHIFFFNV